MSRPVSLALIGAALILSACAVERLRAVRQPSVAPSGSSTFTDPVPKFIDEVRELLRREQFAVLDESAEQLLRTRARFPGGEWKLYRFYGAVQRPSTGTGDLSDRSTNADADDVWEHQIGLLKKWQHARPQSSSAVIALGDAWISYAWSARGYGPGRGVSEDQRRLFKERLAEARAVLVDGEQRGASNPQWYCTMIDLARGEGWDRLRVDAVFDRGVALEPLYTCLYTSKGRYLLPQWYGEPGEWARFAEESTDRVGGGAGSAMYSDIAWDLAKSDPAGRNFFQTGISWPRLQASFINRRELYGASDHDMNVFGFLAGLAGDRRVAREVIARMGDAWDPDLWRNQNGFDQFRQWATAE